MTKKDFRDLMKKVIDDRRGINVEFTSYGYAHVYSDDCSFTATFLCDVIVFAREYFVGVRVDCDGRLYLLFTL